MGFWDSLFGRRGPSTPEEVRRALFDAAEGGDHAALAKLAAAHEATVLAHFAAWKTVPADVRGDPAALQAYGAGLIGLAQHFADERGHPELFEALVGPPGDNPLVKWERALGDADARMEADDFAGAAALLRSTLEAVEGLRGPGADEYLPITLGRLGTCLFQRGDAEGAVAHYTRALALCEAQGDGEGALAYVGNLYEAHRYRGDAEAAAASLERRAALHERSGDRAQAARDRWQAGIVRAGEPLCRVVAEVGEGTIEIAEVAPSVEKVRFVFTRNRLALRPCTAAVEEGVARGEKGDLEGALASFDRAAEADRFDPWPSYHGGMTLLHLRRYVDAIERFARTEALAPGWYHCRADRWLAEQLVEGAVDHEMFGVIRRLVDRALDPDDAVDEGRRALAKKELGVLHLATGDALAALGRSTEALASWRRGLAIAEEPDVRTRLLVALGARTQDRGERERLLSEARAPGGNLLAAAMAAVMLRASEPEAG